jgi:hypothetical protein
MAESHGVDRLGGSSSFLLPSSSSFYLPRFYSDGIPITAACIYLGTLPHVEYRKVDGRNWDKRA